MTTLTLLLVVAAIGAGASRASRLPLAPLALVAGLVAARLPLPLQADIVRQVLVLSGTFLVFVIGANLDVRAAARGRALEVAAIKVSLLGGAAGGVTWAVGFDGVTSAYVGLAFAASSSLAATRLLQHRERMYEPIGRLLVNTLRYQDIVVVVVLSLLVGWGHGPEEALWVGIDLGVLGALAWATARWIGPATLVRPVPDDERQLLVVFALLSLFMGVAHALGAPLVAGAFFAGLALSPFPTGAIVRGHVASFRDFFVPLFYAALGALFRFPTGPELVVVLVVLGAAFLVLPLLIVPLSRRAGLTGRAAVEAALLLATCGELSLVVVLVGFAEGRVDESAVRIIAAVALITMGLLPLTTSERLIWRFVHLLPGWRSVAVQVPEGGHVLIVGCGEGTFPLLADLRDAGLAVVVLDDDPETVARVAALGIVAVRGDGSTRAALERAGLQTARVVASTMGGHRDNVRLIELAGKRPVLVRVFSEREAAKVRAAGGEPVISAEAAKGRFLEWFSREGAPPPSP